MAETNIMEVCEMNGTVEVHLTEDRLAVLVTAMLPADGPDGLIEPLQEQLSKLGISDPVALLAAEHQFREAAQKGLAIDAEVLLEGRPPILPIDDLLKWSRGFFDQGFVVDERTGVVDYRRRLAQDSVAEGEFLGSVLPGQPGVAGRDVFGNEIPVPPPAPVHIRAGKNVRYDSESESFYATCGGRVHLAEDELYVDEVLTIEGSVGLETGHIKHPGSLVVQEHVEAGSQIETKGDIHVLGYVEDATISAGGDLWVQGGITGSEGGVIRVDGTVRAKFVQNVTILAGGDVMIEREVDNAIVRTCGTMRVPKGRIVGGEVMALGGIEVGQAGSDAGIKTLLVAGEDYAIEERIRAREEEIMALRDTVARVHSKLDPLRGREGNYTDKSREAITMLRGKLAQADEKLTGLEARLSTMRDESRQRAKDRIVIHNRAFPDTTFRVARCSIHCRESVPGPVVAQIREGEPGLFATS